MGERESCAVPTILQLQPSDNQSLILCLELRRRSGLTGGKGVRRGQGGEDTNIISEKLLHVEA